jgi:uncharacterized paraquat-inducible protein A
MREPNWIADTCQAVLTSPHSVEQDRAACREAIERVQHDEANTIHWPAAVALSVLLLAVAFMVWAYNKYD